MSIEHSAQLAAFLGSAQKSLAPLQRATAEYVKSRHEPLEGAWPIYVNDWNTKTC